MLSLTATWVLSDAHDRLNAGANYLKRKEEYEKNALSAPCEVNDETGACEKEVCIRSAANLPGRVDSWPRKPAPESWVKLEAGGRLVCKTGKHENNETPQWDFCCYVHGHHEHSEFFFSVFDADFSGDEGDWLGTAVLPGNATAGSYELALSGGEFEIDADAPPPTLTVSIPLFPPPPPPPQNIDAVKVTGGATDKLLFEEAKAGAEAHELRKYLCVMSAKGLIESDFFPRVGKYRYPDSWVRISTFREENKRMGLSPKFVEYALTTGTTLPSRRCTARRSSTPRS
ncbi:hypothetical protein EMIHUDRAFT_456227 [Emiliania huxleyi CCMP1516]|uniref:C2 domain-containing protein n=2 Tax=Emiliania huxleyi TaxID=2903 RepID=A0A0D3K7S3_EMIH1|nr:hypothetical protein EMIHUDRAFT_456227 [Emiliania huxleyi CCMP1516]EOD31808.1 hypothetical protein EMIHUDRAFT_456227 [Emiliania huxleyi CCMP1516]|eukprot:XP_005784237.1 hypothetical protein EMIHUDRAFT_456227 [Emiliania huxleyi CCMP1516]